MKDLIVVKQEVIIEEHLKEMSEEIEKKVAKAQNMICTEENKQSVKKLKKEIKDEFDVLEQQRKAVKNKVLEKYNDFEKLYKQYITGPYTNADNCLKNKIGIIETEQKNKLENEVKTYFNEYIISKNVDFLKFEQLGLKIGVSDNKTALQKKIKLIVDKVVQDLELIQTQDHKEEILVEYKPTLNVVDSINKVKNRIKAIEEEKERLKRLEETKKEEQKVVDNIKEVIKAPEVVKTESNNVQKYTMSFYVRGSLEELSKVKQFLEKEKIEWVTLKKN